MNGTILAEYPWLGTFIWQSVACLAVGLGGSYLLRHRPARAHRLLFIAMIAALAVPAMSRVVRQCEWGLFETASRPVSVPILTKQYPTRHSATPPADVTDATPSPPVLPLTTPTRSEAPAAPLNWPLLLFALWGAVSLSLFVRLLVRFLLGLRLVTRATMAQSALFQAAIKIACDKLSIEQEIAARLSDRVRSPMIWCWGRRPVLLAPTDTSQNDIRLDLVGIVCHELAHWKRRDHVTGLLTELLVAVLPWHPLLWWASRRLTNLSEEACDDWVLACGRPGVDYAETLLTLTPHGHAALVPAVVTSRKGVVGRIRRILQNQCASPHTGRRWSLAAVALAMCLAVGIAFAQTRPAGPQKPEQKPRRALQSVTNDVVDANVIRLGLLDPNGRAVEGAKASLSVMVQKRAVLNSHLSWRRELTSDENGRIFVNINEQFRPQMNREVLYVLHEERQLGAMVELNRRDGGAKQEVRLAPVCQVQGTFASADLEAMGMPLSTVFAEVDWNDRGPIEQMLDKGNMDFTFPLPPGEYELNVYGAGSRGEDPPRLSAGAAHETTSFEVRSGQTNLNLGTLEMHPTKLATLIGQPAPELGQIKAWKNGGPVTLADLKGQAVLLHFSGHYPSISRDIPRLVELHELFGDKGLTIIALYNCASMEELEKNWREAHDRFGGPMEVPFRVAVDGDPQVFHYFRRASDPEDPTATYGRYGITGWPTHVLIDPAGNIAGQLNLYYAKETIGAMLAVRPLPSDSPPRPTYSRIAQEPLQENVPTRVVAFPPDRSYGTLFVRDPNAASWYTGWEQVGPAQGPMQIPAGKQAKLEANEEAAADLAFLAQMAPDDLQMLGFNWEPARITSLEPIGHLTGLRALNLQRTQFDSTEFRYLTGLSRLEVLRFGDYDLRDDSMQYLGQLKSLRSLALWGTGISDTGLQHLQGLTNLTFLALNSCDITDDGLRYLKDMTALEGLQIERTEVTDAGLVHLQHLIHLKHIKLGGDGITDAGLKYIENLPLLENLWIDNNPITNDGFASLAKMRHLKELYASDTKVTDAGLAHLRGLPEFRHIIINNIGDEGVAYLSTLPAMRQLQIHDARITVASVPSFQAMSELKELLLSGDTITDDLLGILRAALPDCKVWDPQRSRQYPMPAWRERFEAVYRLEDDEILKRIAPPFIPERMEYYRDEYSYQAEAIPRGPDTMTFHWLGKLKNWGMSFGSARSVGEVLNRVVGLRSYEYEGPKDLLRFEMPGDWIIRAERPREEKLRALENLIEAEFGRRIRFEKRLVDREVVIATGRFRFHPPVGTYENSSIHMYADEVDANEGSGGGTADSLAEFLEALGNRIGMPVIDRTEPTEEMSVPYRHHRSSFLRRETDPQARARKLRLVLDHLTEQTELHFELTTQPVEVWFVGEETTR